MATIQLSANFGANNLEGTVFQREETVDLLTNDNNDNMGDNQIEDYFKSKAMMHWIQDFMAAKSGSEKAMVIIRT